MVPVDTDQGRNPDAPKVEPLPREVGQVEQLDHHLFGKPEQFLQSRKVLHIGQVRDRLLDQFAVLEKTQSDEGVDLRPDAFVLEKSQAPEGSPSARLAPDRDPDHVRSIAQLDRELLVVVSDEAGILAAAFVFAPGLEFHDLRNLGDEEVPVQREITEEIRLAVFHRQHQRRAVDSRNGLLEGGVMPDQVADGMGADRPGPEDAASPVLLEDGEHRLEASVHRRRILQDQFAAELLLHVESVAFADAKHDAGDLGEVGEEPLHQLDEKLTLLLLVVPQLPLQRRGEGEDVHRQVDVEPLGTGDAEEFAKLLAIDGDLFPDLDLVGLVVGQVRHIVERDPVVADGGDAAAEGFHVLANPEEGPAQLLLRHPLEAQPGKFRPVDPETLVATKERPDRVDQVERGVEGRQVHAETALVTQAGRRRNGFRANPFGPICIQPRDSGPFPAISGVGGAGLPVPVSVMRKIPLLLALTLAPAFAAAELPLLHDEDFSKGAAAWKPTDPEAWKITEVEGNPVYENLGGSKYEPPYRSPLNISLLDDHVVGDFVLTAKVRTTKESYGHRDMCLFFGYQDPANFYYIHLGQKADPHANQIFLVHEAPRIAITEKGTDGTPWQDDHWHEVKIVRDVSSGRIEIYFDDMETPCHVATDKTFTWGKVGLGTFDDKGMWDDVVLRGEVVESPVSGIPDRKKLEFVKWTPDFPVPDPVALSFDPNGVAYVTQTQRRKANDLDIRENTDWIDDDLSFTSPDDKRAFYEEQFVPENSAANAHRVEDLNGDGIHDIRDLTFLSERIHRIADTDGDGFADTIDLYAEQLDDLIGGVAGGVLWRDGDVYVSPVPEVVKFRDTDGDGEADERTVIASGFGVHLAYAGHDMHGLFTGPDGRIYWSIGDKGIRVRTADGLDYRFPNQGGLMRCEPDGSNFEVYARGQRNIQEHSFDAYGNFFGVDNDADFEGERERLVHVEQYLDSGWRANWQYLRDDYNPWNDDLMHVPYFDGQPRWFTPPLANYENGPAGFKWNPGTALGPDYDDFFFLTSAPRGEQWAFRVKPRGDSFAMIDDHKIGEGVPLVGLNFAPDGALYGVDWGGGYPLNQDGAVWRIDVPESERHPDRQTTKTTLETDFGELDPPMLSQLLRHPDQRVRLEAQFELAERKAVDELVPTARSVTADQLARIHAIWGLGQMWRAGEFEVSVFIELFEDPDPEIRAQAIRAVTDKHGRRLGLDVTTGPVENDNDLLTTALVAALDDAVQRVRMQALLGLGRVGDREATGPIVRLLERKEHSVDMAYLRHAGTIALAGAAPIDDIVSLREHDSPFVRTCAVNALRRRGHEAVAVFLKDEDPIIAADAARAIHDDWMIVSALPDLASALAPPHENEPLVRRAINANFRIGDAECAERVAAFVADGEAGESLLAAGLEALENWTEPPVLDLVVGRHRPLDPRDPAVLKEALGRHLDAMLLSQFSSIQERSMALARENEIAIAPETLLSVFQDTTAAAGLRSEALRSLASEKADTAAAAIGASLDDKAEAVRITGLSLLAKSDADAAVERINAVLEKGNIREKQVAIRLLPEVAGIQEIETLVAQLEEGSLDPALHLDVLETAKHTAFAELEGVGVKIQQIEAGWQTSAAEDSLAPFRFAMAGGDAARGKSLFLNHAAAQCVQCHKIADGSGSNVGPNLKDIGKKKDAAYLLEALVDPQKTVASGYGMISLTLKDGSNLAGQFRSEKDGKVVIRDPEGKETKIPVEDIADRSPVVSTMPPMGYLLQKGELRDLMAFLVSLKRE